MSAGWICPNRHFWPTEDADATLDASPACPQCGQPGKPIDPSAVTVEPDSTPPIPPAAARVPGYEILGELGRGGMGVVYKARDERLKWVVALKMILFGGHAGAGTVARFRREVEAVATLQHPNIVQIHAVGEVDGLPYCVLEYVDGGTLAAVIRRGGTPPRRAAETVAILARAVRAAHARGVIHRDLKPANVLLTEEGAPKIADLGLAKRLDAAGTGPTASGAVVGTPAYMAPEQAGENKVVGPPADIYALGAVLYHLLTGHTSTVVMVELTLRRNPVPTAPGGPFDVDRLLPLRQLNFAPVGTAERPPAPAGRRR